MPTTDGVQPLVALRDRLLRLPRRRETLLVGIDGCGGAGKSTLAKTLAVLVHATVVEFDDFYRPSSERGARRDGEVGGAFDWRRVREQILVPLAGDRPARYQRYDWGEDRLAEWHEIQPGGVVIVEGNYSTRSELDDFYDFTIWVEAPREVRLERGIGRGGENTRRRWLEEWMPEEERYIAAENPQGRVDLVIDGSSTP
jgi:uridine kinase